VVLSLSALTGRAPAVSLPTWDIPSSLYILYRRHAQIPTGMRVPHTASFHTATRQ